MRQTESLRRFLIAIALAMALLAVGHASKAMARAIAIKKRLRDSV